MCEGDRPSPEAFKRNLAVDMPWYRKWWLVFRNNARKLFTLSDCCGHAGEPGC